MREGRGPRPRGALRTLVIAAVPALVAMGMAATAPAAVASATTGVTPTVAVGGGPVDPDLVLPQSAGDPVGVADAATLPSGEDASCPVPTTATTAQCFTVSDADASTTGYTPADLQAAYNLTSDAATGGMATPDAAENVAVVTAYNDPNAAADFAAYRAEEGLPACNTTTDAGCLTVVNQQNEPSPLPADAPAAAGDWTFEASADVDTIAALCPNCRLVLVEADDDTVANLANADENAAGAVNFIDNGWGRPEFVGENADDTAFLNQPGKAIVFASGNDGYSTEWPAASQYVTAVGGTTLTADPSVARGYTETAWAYGGSGCSTDEHKPAWQTADDTSPAGCENRTENDVAADADPSTGVAVYDSTAYAGSSFSRAAGWDVAGGTSVAAAIITATYALAGYPQEGTYPASYAYQSGASAGFYSVTSGTNGTCETDRQYLCNAADSLTNGFNGPAGMGTPDGTTGLTFIPPSNGSNVISVVNPGSQDYEVNTKTVSLGMSATDSAVGQTLAWSATGLPSGLTINSSTGTISGSVGASASTSAVTVTASDEVGSGSVSFDIYVTSSTAAAYHDELGAVHLNTNDDCLDDTGGVTTDGNKVQVYECNGDSASQAWGWTPDGGPGGAGVMTLAANSAYCLAVSGNGTTAGTSVELWACNGTGSQQWRIESGGELLNTASGLCLTAPNTTNGTQIQINTCNGAATQQWTPTPSPVQSAVTSMCMDDTGGATTAGNKIQIYTCNGDQSSQDWNFEPADTVQIQGTSNCLTVTGASTLDGAPLELEPCNGSTSQQWLIGPLGELVNLNSGRCADDPDNTTTNGTQLIQDDCYHLPGEVWDPT
jgi:hypothetical protein